MFIRPVPHASMACSSLAPGRSEYREPRVPRTEKSCGATDKNRSYLSRERPESSLPVAYVPSPNNRPSRYAL